MLLFPEGILIKCMTNKMIWLSEDKERALSYGSDLKIFKTNTDIDLWNLMDPNPYPFKIESSDEEFQGKIQKYPNFLLFLEFEIKDIIFNKNHDCHPNYKML